MTGHLRDLSSDLSSWVFWELEVLISGPSWYVFFLKETGSFHRHNNLKRVCLGTMDGTLSSSLWGRAVRGREQAILAFQRGLYLPAACSGVWELSVQHRHRGAWWTGKDFLCRRNCAGSKSVCPWEWCLFFACFCLSFACFTKAELSAGLLHVPQEPRNETQHMAESKQRCTSAVHSLFKKNANMMGVQSV